MGFIFYFYRERLGDLCTVLLYFLDIQVFIGRRDKGLSKYWDNLVRVVLQVFGFQFYFRDFRMQYFLQVLDEMFRNLSQVLCRYSSGVI